MIFARRLALLLVCFTGSLNLLAASIEMLIMPGPVVSGHAELEETCSNCHDLFDQSAQQILCLDCHEEIATDLASSEGFHSLNPQVAKSQCKQCHSEHLGRDADIVALQEDLFNHNFTDLPLLGSHQNLICSSCHEADHSYSEAPTACASCHEDDDIHRGNLGEECATCHEPDSWSQGQFDHSTTDFELTGKHTETTCVLCHVDQKYEDTNMQCVDCHRLDDKHGGAQGDECESCHTSESWETSFDHEKETGYPLVAAHSSLQCSNCHVSQNEYSGLPTSCEGCHRSNDVHLGRNGTECEQCHNEDNWQTEFDHLLETEFALQGAHNDLSCTACHVGKLSDPLETDCLSCHAKDNPHGDTLVQCANCHAQSDWMEDIRFHHELSRFPLVGMHGVTSCEQCHATLEFSPMALDCQSCHAADDVHERALGDACESCHNPVNWNSWLFDHDTQTDFALDGAHTDLECAACHPPSNPAEKQAQACYACHRTDDPHRGGFGRQCAQCHNSSNFSEVEIGN